MPPSSITRALCAAVCAAALGRGACGAAAEQPPAGGGAVTARLEFREHVARGARAGELQVPVDPTREVEFRAEPAYAPGTVVRGVLPVGAEPRDAIGFAWESGARRLHVDLNRDLDLTNDPDGVFITPAQSGLQIFPEVPIEVERDGTARRYLLEVHFWAPRYSSYNSFALRSGWAGAVEIGGQRYEIAIQDNMDGAIGEGDELCIGPEEKPQARHAGRLPQLLLLGGVAYRVTGQFEPEGQVGAVSLRLEPAETPMGTLDLAGASLEGLVLEGACTAVLSSPAAEVRLPVGDYAVRTIEARPGIYASIFGTPISFRIQPGETTRLPIGGRLRPEITVQARGSMLVFNYRLLGQGGEEYSPQELGQAPELEIRRGDRVLASDSFEFG